MTRDKVIEAMTDAENVREAVQHMKGAERSIEDALDHIEGLEEVPSTVDDEDYLVNLYESVADVLSRARTRRKSVESAAADYGMAFEGFATECLLYPAGEHRQMDAYVLDVLETQQNQKFRYIIAPDDDGNVTEVLVQRAWKPDTGKSLDPKSWAVNTGLAWGNLFNALVEETGWSFPEGHDAEDILTFTQDIA